MALANFQGSYAGLTWGPGTEIQLMEIDGLRGLPEITSTDLGHMRSPGVFSGWDVLGGRTITLKLLVVAVSDLEAQIANIEAAFTPLANATSEMVFQLPGWTAPRSVFCRTRKRDIKIDQNYQFGMASVSVEVFAPDPRIYSAVTFTNIPTGGSAVITNLGNFEVRPVLQVAPTASPCTIANAGDSGNQVILANSAITTLLAAGNLTVDILNRAVTDGSGANRYDLVSSSTTWFALQPGVNNVSITNGSVAVGWRSAWI